MTLWTPDQPPSTGRLSKAEQRWLDQQAEADTPGATRVRRPGPYADRMLQAASQALSGLCNATAAIPPPKRSNVGSSRRTGTSDPTGAQVGATVWTVDTAFARLGHILDDCRLCEDDMPPLSCNSTRDLTLARLDGGDYMELADHVVGLSHTSPKAVAEVTPQVLQVFSTASVEVVDIWGRMHRSGAESQRLRDYCGQIVEVTARLRSVCNLLAQWIPDSLERLCKNEGCRRPAPPLDDGAVERGGAQCPKCLKLAHEERTA